MPGDVSVVGIDDSMRAKICEVPLTTVRHPQQQLGERAAELLLKMIGNPSAGADDMLFTPKLIVRDSTQKADMFTAPNECAIQAEQVDRKIF